MLTPPTLHHQELKALFEHDLRIPDDVLAPITALPRETLLADLETLIRWAMGLDMEALEEEGNDWFFFHALMLLGELHAEEHLPLVLDVFRMPEEKLDGWFGDMWLEDFWYVLLWCGQHNISELIAFIKDRSVPESFTRVLLVDTLVHLAFHFPERQAEMTADLGELLSYFSDLEPIDNDEINVATSVANAVIDLQARELLPLVHELFEKEKVDDLLYGDWGMYLEEFDYVHDSDRNLCYTYRDWLDTRGVFWRKMAYENEKEKALKPLSLEDKIRILKDLNTEQNLQKRMLSKGLSSLQQDTNGVKKIGRNYPCPCGSGKKYKKCCGA